MDAEAVNILMQAIGTVGFPIVCCCVLFYLFYRMNETMNAIDKTLTRVLDRLDVDERKED